MNFKTDWSFLDKISMGAVGSKKVISQLNASGHNIIELERYSTCNKIWSTKIKRLRLPDLICLNCGKRIESRAKSTLAVKMSDNANNPQRHWDSGLRDDDIVAFIHCTKEDDDWIAGSTINAFTIKSMRDSVGASRLGSPKSRYEGSERDREWKTIVPKKDGKVIEIVDLKDKKQIRVCYEDGTKYTYSLKDPHNMRIYCSKGDSFKGNESIIAGVIGEKESLVCKTKHYSFIDDLKSKLPEVRYAGAKALGYLGQTKDNIDSLYTALAVEQDTRIKLEIYASLLRLDENLWDDYYNYAMSLQEPEYRMEYALILGEFVENSEASKALVKIANNSAFEEELRAAAIWGMKVNSDTIPNLLMFARNDSEIISNHAIARLKLGMKPVYTKIIVDQIVDDSSGSIVLNVLVKLEQLKEKDLVNILLSEPEDSVKRKWILKIIGMLGKDRFMMYEKDLCYVAGREIIESLWQYKKYEIPIDRIIAIDFLEKQGY